MSENRECRAGTEGLARIQAPHLDYLPRSPGDYWPCIGLIGCGGIAPYHLRAYKKAAYRVVALCDSSPFRAQVLQEQFYPAATVYADYKELLNDEDVDVVDIATHPEIRTIMIEDALAAGKHVLSQKPFVTDLDRGLYLVELAKRNRLKVAVNQNGRWAPHFSWMRHAVAEGLIGDLTSAHFAVHWNHDWTAGTTFDEIRHLILFDFAVHWFDMLTCLMAGKKAKRVFATTSRAPGQNAKPPLLAQAVVDYDDAQASLVFDGFTSFGARDHTVLVGTNGTLISDGPDLNTQTVTLYTKDGYATPLLEGDWFSNGFLGAMAELLCAIEEDRTPIHDGRANLESLALCFAAIESADTGMAVVPGSVRRLPKGT